MSHRINKIEITRSMTTLAYEKHTHRYREQNWKRWNKWRIFAFDTLWPFLFHSRTDAKKTKDRKIRKLILEMMKCDQRGKSISLYDNILEFNKVYSMKAQISRRTAMVALTKIRSDKYFFIYSLFYARFVSFHYTPFSLTPAVIFHSFRSSQTTNSSLTFKWCQSRSLCACVYLSLILCVFIFQSKQCQTIQFSIYFTNSKVR